MSGTRVGFDKQAATAEGFQLPYNLPRIFRMTLRVTPPHSYYPFSEMRSSCNRTVLRVYPVCASARVRFVSCLKDTRKFFSLSISNNHLISHICCNHEVSLCCIPTAIMQEPFCLYLC